MPREAIEKLLSLFKPLPNPHADFNPVELLAEFGRACRIDYRLADSTVRDYMRYVQGLLIFLDRHPLRATRQDLRQYLATIPAANAVKALRVLYGRFLDSDLAKCFKIPRSSPGVVIVPSRAQLLWAYENLGDPELEAAFLLFAASSLRRHELVELTPSQVDMEKRMVVPNGGASQTKFQWVTFFNDEAETALRRLLLAESPRPDGRIFKTRGDDMTRSFKRASGGTITPKVLRAWFCNEMGHLGVQDRYVDAFCGRVPKSVLAKHYTDYSPERLKEVYDKANLRVLEEAEVTG